MKKGDYIVIFIILLIAGFTFLYTNKKNISEKNNYKYVLIEVNGKEYKRLPLEGNNKIKIKTKYGNNTVEIKDGKVKMAESDCKDKICIHMKSISIPGQSIICLPNRIVVSIEQEGEKEVDVVIH